MSWIDELYKVYEYNCNREFDEDEPIMLPVLHSTANAQIELKINKDGEFKGAITVEKKESVTIIPATEDSTARTNGVAPMPFADKLVYIAGDYGNYVNGKYSDNSKYYNEYMKQLKNWKDSEYSYYPVNALYRYLEKKCLMSDLVKSGVLKVDETTGKLQEKSKIDGIEQEKSFVRVVVISPDGVNRTWQDSKMYNNFINYYINTLKGEKQLCYGSGKYEIPTYKHPVKIRNSGDKAKLISTNDESGFTYRGRFENKEQAISVGYIYSQKIHNALRWLIQKQGMNIDSLTIVMWASMMQDIPMIDEKIISDDEIPTDLSEYMLLLKRSIFGCQVYINPGTKIMIMGLDAATTGRLNISHYSELAYSEYLNNLHKWHSQISFMRYSVKAKKNIIKSFTIKEIINYAFGIEQGDSITCSDNIMKRNILRIAMCVIYGNPIPEDVVRSLYYKASNPAAYDKNKDKKTYHHNAVLETACGVIRKNLIERQKGDIGVSYNPNLNDRSYLFGCLLAIADNAESEAYNEIDRNQRVTNAKRYWNAFSKNPCQTWAIIEKRLIPYLNQLKNGRIKYDIWIDEIQNKMTEEDFTDDSCLDPIYLLGYHHFRNYMFNYNAKNKEEK